jgi:hypothetical protein
MGEQILSILFGCMATVLAVVSIVLAYIQCRTYLRQSAHNATPAALEIGHSTVSTSSDDLEQRFGRWSILMMLRLVMTTDLVQKLYVSTFTICTIHLANEYRWSAFADSKPWTWLRRGH